MPFLIPKPGPVADAFRIARDRGLLPSALSSREQREAFAAELRAKAVHSARTTSEVYLEAIQQVVLSITGDARAAGDARSSGMSVGEGRVALRAVLEALEYTPEGGFPGNEGEVPPAVVGTIEDLSSRRRLDLIIETQVSLMQGRARRDQGREAIEFFPAWELVRYRQSEVPRDWFERFEEAGGTILTDAQGRKRLTAHKNDPVWDALGDSALFDDALDVNHPPFAFQSGMNWRNVSHREYAELGGVVIDVSEREESGSTMLPENVATFKDEGSLGRLRKLFKTVEVEGNQARARDLRENRRANRAKLQEEYFAAFGKEDSQ